MKTTLKLTFAIFFLFTSMLFCQAQDAMAAIELASFDLERKEGDVEKETAKQSAKQIYRIQTQMATKQMVSHLAEKITYPDYLKDQYIEGQVIIEVLMDKDGEIRKAILFQKLQTELDQLVMDAVKEMGRIDLKGMPYKGARRFRIPVNFSFQ